LVDIGIGTLFLLQDKNGTRRNQAFADARAVIPIYGWALIFLGSGLSALCLQRFVTRWRQIELRIVFVVVGLIGWFFWAMFLCLGAQSNDLWYGPAYMAFAICSIHLIVAVQGD